MPFAMRSGMEESDFDLGDVLRLARQLCRTTPPCMECVAEATADLVLERELGPDWREALEERPAEDPVPV
jgi:hypothetical protein